MPKLKISQTFAKELAKKIAPGFYAQEGRTWDGLRDRLDTHTGGEAVQIGELIKTLTPEQARTVRSDVLALIDDPSRLS